MPAQAGGVGMGLLPETFFAAIGGGLRSPCCRRGVACVIAPPPIPQKPRPKAKRP